MVDFDMKPAKQFLIPILGLFLVIVVWFLFGRRRPPFPTVVRAPRGISQRSVREVRIKRGEWLSPTRSLVWVSARLGERKPRQVSILVDLVSGASLYLIENAEPVAWLNENEVLFRNGESADPKWKRIVRKMGFGFPIDYCTRFYRFNVKTGTLTILTDIHTGKRLGFFTVSKDRRWGVGTWGPLNCFEIDLVEATVRKVDEAYVWSPCFVGDKTFVFVGETSIESRRVGPNVSESISQPLLEEIRDAIIEKGTPSIQLCGRLNGQILGVDHSPLSDYDRLLRVDETTSIVSEVTRLRPSRNLPRFNSRGTEFVYQGHLFEGDMDSVYYQEVRRNSEPITLVHGKEGDVNQSTPVFLDDETVLYVHWGRELQSISLNSEKPKLHWPMALVP